MKRRMSAVLPAMICLLSLLIPAGAISAHAKGQPTYLFAVDKLLDTTEHNGGGSALRILRDIAIPAGEPLTLQGWVATDEGIAGYRYMWVPEGGTAADWREVEEADIFPRQDLAGAGISHASGHATAGYSLSISPPAELPAGYYDIYIRAVDGMGEACDLLALLHTRYGNTDADHGQNRTVSLDRLVEEGNAALRGDAAVTATEIVLSPDGRVRLGNLNLAGFEEVRISYTLNADPADPSASPADDVLLLGLKSDGAHSYGTPAAAGGRYNMTDSLGYAAIAGSSGTVTLSLDEVMHDGEVWLTTYADVPVRITDVTFLYNGQATDRVAAKLHFSGGMTEGNFGGVNHVDLKPLSDPVLGDVLRMEVKEATNDPYVYFYADRLLATENVRLSADEYRYMVVLARALPQNNRPHMTFYLCAGSITGATEACTYTTALQTDGEWHYYLFDLSKTENWSGLIHGWRFDIINGDSNPGDAVDFASIQFFRTPEAAAAAAARPIDASAAYSIGDPAVERDMSEEVATPTVEISPEDTYLVTEPATDAPTEPVTTSDQPAGGCASTVVSAVVPTAGLLLCAAAMGVLARRRARRDV